ncbi:YqgE/AlgH family protein [Sediminispirochaeta bajacaliforniensis]|uniref:YqgE/AlgH family protein n=1 Tax=Sediminispirochaeta bajacaliforniensis TaxID=148 RepID=UPI00035D2C9E|nr:YqgE/AlgH family protein [Sediminispirochaeta bajacaliforniensis]
MDAFTLYGEPTPPLEDELPVFLTGHLLVAESSMTDPNFSQTAVFLLNHDENGAMGLVINRPSTTVLGDAVEELGETPWREELVFVGGPVQQYFVFVLHTGLPGGQKSPAAIEATPGVIFEPDFSVVKPALNQEDTINLRARFLVGYAGWAPGQLETELARKDWIVIPGSPELVFSDTPFSVWRSALRKKGGIYWIAAETGFKPSIN